MAVPRYNIGDRRGKKSTTTHLGLFNFVEFAVDLEEGQAVP